MQVIDVIGGGGLIGTTLICCLSNDNRRDVKIVDKASSLEFAALVQIGDVRSVE